MGSAADLEDVGDIRILLDVLRSDPWRDCDQFWILDPEHYASIVIIIVKHVRTWLRTECVREEVEVCIPKRALVQAALVHKQF